MKSWKQVRRSGIPIALICEHGVNHLDPDIVPLWAKSDSQFSKHQCCDKYCCSDPSFPGNATPGPSVMGNIIRGGIIGE